MRTYYLLLVDHDAKRLGQHISKKLPNKRFLDVGVRCVQPALHLIVLETQAEQLGHHLVGPLEALIALTLLYWR